jgi:ribonuclease HI
MVHEDSGAFDHTTSSMTMEVMAVTKTLSWLETQAFTNVCILSHTVYMLRKIEANWRHREWLESLRRSNLVCIFVIFVPGHAGVWGNEQADRLNGTAVISDGHAMDHADELHALLEAGRVEDLLEDGDSSTIE